MSVHILFLAIVLYAVHYTTLSIILYTILYYTLYSIIHYKLYSIIHYTLLTTLYYTIYTILYYTLYTIPFYTTVYSLCSNYTLYTIHHTLLYYIHYSLQSVILYTLHSMLYFFLCISCYSLHICGCVCLWGIFFCLYVRVYICELTMVFLLQSVLLVCVSDWSARVTKGCPGSLICQWKPKMCGRSHANPCCS